MAIELKCITTNVLYRYIDNTEDYLKAGSIHLTSALTRDTRWVEAVICGTDSVITPGDKLLLSFRAVSLQFEHPETKELLMNTADASCLAYKHNGQLKATGKTMLYEWLEEQEETTASGIVLMKKTVTKEFEPRWAKVHAAGADTGVQAGDMVLLAWKHDAYKIEIDGVELHNGGVEEIITFYTPGE